MTPAVKLLDKLKIPYTIRQYSADAEQRNFGEHAASELDQNPQQVFKTLMAVIDGNTKKPVVALVAVADQLDLKKLAAACNGRKAAMAEPQAAQRMTGYIVGGISPLGQRQQYATCIDAAARNFDTIFVSGGRRGLQLELGVNDLAKVLNANITDLAR